MVLFIVNDGEGTVDLFQEDEAAHFMCQCQSGQGKDLVGFIQCIFGDLQVGQLKQKALHFEGVFQNKLETMLTAVLIKGQTEGQFELQDAAGDAAAYLLSAFGIYLYELGIYHKSMDEIIPKAEKMFTFIIRAIEPH